MLGSMDFWIIGSMVSIIDRHAGLVGQTCRFASIKKPPCLPMLPSKNPNEPNWEGRRVAVPIPALPWKNRHEPNSLPETQPPHGVLYFSSEPIHRWFKKPVRFQAI
jgi:hypothetical protein